MDALTNLHNILRETEILGKQMGKEADLYQAELADRQAKDLTGADTVKHFNDWMERAGRPDLKIK